MLKAFAVLQHLKVFQFQFDRHAAGAKLLFFQTGPDLLQQLWPVGCTLAEDIIIIKGDFFGNLLAFAFGLDRALINALRI